jgi:hypothetical protein
LQQCPGLTPYEADLLGLSMEKGGASVMADAYLIDPDITFRQAENMFAFGVFLQLADDLQDVNDDLAAGHMTIFSQNAGKWPLDGLTKRLFSLMEKVTCFEDSFSTPSSGDMSGLIKKAGSLLLLTSIAQNRKYYSWKYLKEVEKRSPVSFIHYDRIFKKMGKELAGLMEKCRRHPLDLHMADAVTIALESKLTAYQNTFRSVLN